MNNLKKSYSTGLKLKMLRTDAGMTQSQLGDAIGGLSDQQIRKYENGTSDIPISKLPVIARVLNVEVLDILGDDLVSDQVYEPAEKYSSAKGYVQFLKKKIEQYKIIIEEQQNLIEMQNEKLTKDS
jgi:transcriptional regulator with XRE-family HTH domain